MRARTAGQDAYIRALKRHELVFGVGPAGTGKTWLAVAYAVALFERKEVDRIICTRPAVEAGERLGFLPGDMREKIDPYLRPVYDALGDLMDARIVERAMQSGEIEIAPLAFMRGRTLSNAVVILDEAQNTTSMQMKMFLTRLGENSRMIVTGDPSQTDLPPGQTSGLSEAVRLLADVEGIGHVAFTADDVVRHELVARIVRAYDAAAAKKREQARSEHGRKYPRSGDRHRGRVRVVERCGRKRAVRRAIEEAATALGDRFPQPRARRAADRRRRDPPAQCAMARHRQADQRAVVPAGRHARRQTVKSLGDIAIAYETTAREAGDGRQAVRRSSRASCRAWISASDGLRSRERTAKPRRWSSSSATFWRVSACPILTRPRAQRPGSDADARHRRAKS